MKKASDKSNIEIIRNYLSGERPFTQVGYVPPVEEKHKDGDIWKDKDGIEWIQKGASKISKKLYDTRELTRQLCSSCKKDIFWSNSEYDQKFFVKTGKCYDCVIEEEHKMRVEGTFDLYEKLKVIHNQRSFLEELQTKIEESITWLTNKSNKLEYFNEDGTSEKWTDLAKDGFIEEAQKDLTEVKKSIIICSESISMLENELNDRRAKATTDVKSDN